MSIQWRVSVNNFIVKPKMLSIYFLPVQINFLLVSAVFYQKKMFLADQNMSFQGFQSLFGSIHVASYCMTSSFPVSPSER